MKLTKYLFSVAMVFGFAATVSAQTSVIGPGIGLGNGEFEISDPSETSLFQANPAAVGTLNLDRQRFLFDTGPSTGLVPLDLFNFATVIDGTGVVIDGWTSYRTAYSGSSPAQGFDGNYGFAGVGATDPGGQAFTNAGSFALVSDAYAISGAGVGDVFDLAFLAGSDQSSVTDYRAFLVFDDSMVVELTAASATDVPQGNFNRDLTAADAALELSDTFTTTAAYTTVRAMIVGEAATPLNRALVDNVRLGVTTGGGGGGTLLGDVNLDGVVDFLDISPFITVLSSNGFQDEADIDRDGSVTFQDIQPFIGILSGTP